MKHVMIRVCLLVIGIVIIGLMVNFTLSQASTLKQGHYAALLAEKLGLGKGLKAEQATVMLEGVGIVPTGGWLLRNDVDCELVAEVQVLTIKSAQMGLIRYAAEDIPPLMTALSDESGVCAPPKVEAIYPAVAIPPPPPVASEAEAGGGGGRGSGGGGTSSPSE
jgi:hypothetical protein